MALRASHLLFAAALCGLAGCVPPGPANAPVLGTGPGGPNGAPNSQRVAILLPLTGPDSSVARGMLNAAHLALGTGGLQLDVRDTHGTPGGAAEAAAASVDAHDMMIIGPLTSPETAAAAQAAHGIPMLAFTSDPQQARPGVWPLGITPEQQSERLVQALRRQGKTRIAAILPDNPFGTALVDGLNRAAATGSDAPPIVRRYATGQFSRLDAALRDIAGRRPHRPRPFRLVPAPPCRIRRLPRCCPSTP